MEAQLILIPNLFQIQRVLWCKDVAVTYSDIFESTPPSFFKANQALFGDQIYSVTEIKKKEQTN